MLSLTFGLDDDIDVDIVVDIDIDVKFLVYDDYRARHVGSVWNSFYSPQLNKMLTLMLTPTTINLLVCVLV